MQRSMIIDSGKTLQYNICPNRECRANKKGVVPKFYSEKHAEDAGWRKTNDITFCEPGKKYAWVCPECWP